MIKLRSLVLALGLSAAALYGQTGALAQHHGHGHGAAAADAAPAHAAVPDLRELVKYPPAMRDHTLANMRDHLLALAQIQEALAANAPDRAAQIAEQRLGMTSLKAHNAHEAAKLMPQGMQDVGTSMHRSASQFAVEAQNAAATGDLKPALAALARTTQACVACHAGYRLQ